MQLSLESVRAVMGLRPDILPGLVLERAQPRTNRLAATVLTLVHAQGLRLGATGKAQLAAANARRTEYAHLTGIAAEHAHLTVLKGAAVEHCYPDGILRTSHDVDLLIPDEDELWAAVAAVDAARPGAEPAMSLLESPGRRDWAVALTWPAPESDLEYPYAAEFVTAAFTGDNSTVPLRPGHPDNPEATQLLCIAEELFQQKPRGRDVLDAAVLMDATGDAGRPALLRAAAQWRLAPELLRLAEAVAAVPQLRCRAAAGLAQDLAQPAAAETARRSTGADRAPRTRYGFFLGRGPALPRTVVEERQGLTMVRCPVGGFLLVDGPVVSPELVDAACRQWPQAALPG
ncbi:hypothetical protein [Streptomyces sp. NBC_00859]|uniref:hypothetical protein n=1 Tax=Streptomyces sp. NBC_00859 TaxID=2903682 RepID=UPI0038667769|nr:nucleotidyltransferase family protein [Streptomyces sp. NBC_00859]WSZ86726.1 nucleotidyltransferase family protein [Streptomyces sp. NBC_00859]